MFVCVLSRFRHVLCDPVGCSLLCLGDSPGKNTGVGCHALLQGDLPHPGIKPTSLRSPALVGRLFTASATWEAMFEGLLNLLHAYIFHIFYTYMLKLLLS